MSKTKIQVTRSKLQGSSSKQITNLKYLGFGLYRQFVSFLLSLVAYLFLVSCCLLLSTSVTNAQSLTHTTRLSLPVSGSATVVFENKEGVEKKSVVVSDYLSSTKLIIDETGKVIETPEYYPYGNLTTPNQTGFPEAGNDRYYTGQRKVTDDSPVYNYNARYYNPDYGLFIQPDTVEGINRFAYVGNNPMMNNDPSGHTVARGGRPMAESEGAVPLNIEDYIRHPEQYGDRYSMYPTTAKAIPDWTTQFKVAASRMGLYDLGYLAGFALGMTSDDPRQIAYLQNMQSLDQYTSKRDAYMNDLVDIVGGTIVVAPGPKVKGKVTVSGITKAQFNTWKNPSVTQLKATKEFKDAIDRILNGAEQIVISADSGRPIVFSDEAIKNIKSVAGKKMRDKQFMDQFYNSLYKISQDPLHSSLGTHKAEFVGFNSSNINGDWRVAWDWKKIDVKVEDCEVCEIGAVEILTIGNHDGSTRVYR